MTTVGGDHLGYTVDGMAPLAAANAFIAATEAADTACGAEKVSARCPGQGTPWLRHAVPRGSEPRCHARGPRETRPALWPLASRRKRPRPRPARPTGGRHYDRPHPHPHPHHHRGPRGRARPLFEGVRRGGRRRKRRARGAPQGRAAPQRVPAPQRAGAGRTASPGAGRTPRLERRKGRAPRRARGGRPTGDALADAEEAEIERGFVA